MRKIPTAKIFGITLLSILLLILSVMAQSKKKHLEIAITINELPASLGFTPVDKQALNYLMLQALRNHDVKATGFVVGRYIEEDFDILGKWLNDGHTLGNMTNTNQDYHQIDATSFIDDIRVGNEVLEPMISGFGQKKRYFRFPYLHYGATEDDKAAAMIYLEDQQMVVSHATVLVDDYLFNLTLEKMGKYPDSVAFEQLRQEYLEHITLAIQDAEFKSKDLLKRYCSQILMLRANRLNALMLEDILQTIERMDYKFVTLDRALSDPVFHKAEAYFGTRGLGYLDMIIQSDPDLLPAE
jgi:peptidoglycan/xylan/chitin deacetylase (PgdA/CDA1 family)